MKIPEELLEEIKKYDKMYVAVDTKKLKIIDSDQSIDEIGKRLRKELDKKIIQLGDAAHIKVIPIGEVDAISDFGFRISDLIRNPQSAFYNRRTPDN